MPPASSGRWALRVVNVAVGMPWPRPEENRRGWGCSELSEAGKRFGFMFDSDQTVPTHPLKSEKLGACIIAGPF